MSRSHPIRDAAIALTSMTAIPTPPEWLEGGRVQAAGWFPAIGGVLGAAAYLLVKLAERTGVLAAAPFAIACIVVALWTVLTWGLHWRALTALVASLLGRTVLANRQTVDARDADAPAETAPWVRPVAAGIVALLVAGEAAIIGSFVVEHQSPVLVIPLLARVAATAAAWLGTPVDPEGEGGALFGRPSVISAVAAGGAVALAVVALWTGFGAVGLVIAGVGVLTALAVPHLMSMAFQGVTLDVMEASVAVTEVIAFIAFALLH